MTKEEAMYAMGFGLSVTHRFFEKSEYIRFKDGKIVDEQGYELPDFWTTRILIGWLTGWEIYDSN